ncbi:phospholipid scramblase 1-like [Anopheles cruzii]|uniref:phospholipid scramblase 1-like n=1 Tax=Anopheles cruzii TaxID=68878 RepID=UPI0022EC5D39|nr:phospholipid scramblase 1-like [Anopheles cruzii]
MCSARAPQQQDFQGPDTPTFDLSWDYNYDNTLAAPPNNVPPVVHTGENRIISAQPQPMTNGAESVRPSMLSPLSVIRNEPIRSVNSPFLTPFSPRAGLDFLYGLPSVFIQQSYELNELLSGVASDNRYTIRGPSNEALYGASETSDPRDRFWGSLRPFQLSLVDRNHQEVLLFKKNLGCGVFCCFCKNQFLEIWASPGELIGCIQQDYGILSQEIILLNSDINIMFRVPIPFVSAIRMPKETHFRVMDRDLLTQKGTITRAWNVNTSSYTNNIYFSDPSMDVKFKSLFIAAAFLLEYLYFQSNCC